MRNKNVSLAMRNFLETKQYSPLVKFFILLKLDAHFRANDETTKKLLQEKIKNGLKEYAD